MKPKCIKYIVLRLIIVLSGVSGFSQKENLKKAVKEAIKELKNDKADYIYATKICEKVAEDDCIVDEALFIKIAESYYFNSNYSKAAEWFGRYYKIDSVTPLPEHDYWYGQSLKVLNKYRKADSLLAPYYRSKGEQYTYRTQELNSAEKLKTAINVAVPFAIIDDIPVFPGCEAIRNKRACFNKMMQKHIKKNLRYPEKAQRKGVEGRVSVNFVIKKDGSIGDISMYGPDKYLEKEVARIIAKLPKMAAGMQRGKPVRVPFSMPIMFKLQ